MKRPGKTSACGRACSHLGLHFCFALLSDECLPNAEGDARLVHRLVRSYGHVDLVSHAKQQQPSFRTVDSYLSDQLVLILLCISATRGG